MVVLFSLMVGNCLCALVGMKTLDDDKGNLKAGGKAAERDIVQFVQYVHLL